MKELAESGQGFVGGHDHGSCVEVAIVDHPIEHVGGVRGIALVPQLVDDQELGVDVLLELDKRCMVAAWSLRSGLLGTTELLVFSNPSVEGSMIRDRKQVFAAIAAAICLCALSASGCKKEKVACKAAVIERWLRDYLRALSAATDTPHVPKLSLLK